jgi:hypothetical protein
MDVAKHLGNSDAALQAATLDAIETLLTDDAGQKFCKQNGKLVGALSAYVDLTSDVARQTHAKALLQKLAQ